MSGKHVAPAVSAGAVLATAAASLGGTVAPASPAAREVKAAVLDAQVVRQLPRARPLVTRIVSESSRRTYTIVAGDTLSGIAGEFCADAHQWPGIWQQNQAEIPDPDLIYPGQKLTFTCDGVTTVTQVAAAADPAGQAADSDQDDQPQAPVQQASAVITSASGIISTAGMSAFEQCVISRESGGNAQAVNPVSRAGGLFQFLPSTWAALGFARQYPGGAQTAPVAVQEQAFAEAYAQSGTADWAPYDGCH